MLAYIGGKNKQSGWLHENAPSLTSINKIASLFGGSCWEHFKNGVEYPGIERVAYNDFNKFHLNAIRCFTFQKQFLETWDKLFEKGGELYFENKTKAEVKKLYKSYWAKWKKELQEMNENNYDKIGIEKPDFDLAVKYLFALNYNSNGFSPIAPKQVGFVMGFTKYEDDEIIESCKQMKHYREWRKIIRSNKTNFNYYLKLLAIKNWETKDFFQFFNEIDSPTTYSYLDPPYLFCEAYYRKEEGKKTKVKRLDKIHMRVWRLMKKARGKVMLSYSYEPILEKLYPRSEYYWKVKDFVKSSVTNEGKETNIIKEVLIMNYNPDMKVDLIGDVSFKENLNRTAKISNIIQTEIPKIYEKGKKKKFKMNDKDNLVVVRDKKRHGYRYTSHVGRAVTDLIVNHGWSKIKVMRKFGIGSYNTIDKMIDEWIDDASVNDKVVQTEKKHHSKYVKSICRLKKIEKWRVSRNTININNIPMNDEFFLCFPTEKYKGFTINYDVKGRMKDITVSNKNEVEWVYRYHGNLVVKYNPSTKIEYDRREIVFGKGEKEKHLKSVMEIDEVCIEDSLEEILYHKYEVDWAYHSTKIKLSA